MDASHATRRARRVAMNKPIRTVSIFCLLLFLALALNATYLQYYHANALNDRVGNGRVATATFSRDRGAILGRTAGDRRERAEPRPVQVPAGLPRAVHVRADHRLVHLRQRDRHRAHPELLPLRRGRPAVRQPARRPGQRQRHQGRQRRAHHQPRGAEGRVRRAARAWARTSRAPSWRSSRARGKILAMVSLPTLRPEQAGRPRLQEAASNYATPLSKLPSHPLLNRAVQTTLPPGLDVQDRDRVGARCRPAATPPPRWCRAVRATRSRSRTKRRPQRGPDCGTTKIPFTQAMECSCNTSFAPLAVEVGADRDAQDRPRGSASTSATSATTSPQPGDLAVPRRHGRGPDGAVGVRAGLGDRDPPADGDGHRRHRQPRRGDEALPRSTSCSRRPAGDR